MERVVDGGVTWARGAGALVSVLIAACSASRSAPQAATMGPPFGTGGATSIRDSGPAASIAIMDARVANAAGGSSGASGGVPPTDRASDGGGAKKPEDAAVDAGRSSDASPPMTGDRCDVAVLDPMHPPVALDLTGNLGTHDPSLIEENGVFHLFNTGQRLPGKTSKDLMQWDAAPAALGASNPAWIATQVPGATDLWAPDLSQFGGRFHLFYAASTFGSNASCIGHATRDTFASGSFVDQGSVICSNHGTMDDWNAIDPNVIVDQDGTPWLVFGSFWSGIKAVRLKSDGTRADTELHALASRNGGAIEAPFVVRRCGYYYLFVSFDACCKGTSSTYNIRVGRSAQLLGPYLDKDGKDMMQGGGTQLVVGAGRWHGPGHNAVIFVGKRAYNVFHAYDGNANGASMLRVAELAWDADGWPVSGGP